MIDANREVGRRRARTGVTPLGDSPASIADTTRRLGTESPIEVRPQRGNAAAAVPIRSA